MKIDLHRIPVRDIVEGYADDGEGGVRGYGGRLDIRPPYQREFVYDDTKRAAVIQTVLREFPLNVMYWAVNDNNTYEVLDGQQRTISVCQYVAGDFSVIIDGNPMAFHNLTQTQKDQILDYEMMVYFCEGDDKERLDWFQTINIAGEKLTPQELRNAVYTGPWLSHAKSIFSKSGGPAYGLASKYVKGSPIRQELLEKALQWKSGGDIAGYMSAHQQDPNANELWSYFRNVIQWVQDTFTTYRKEMKGVEWGPLYDTYGQQQFDTVELEDRTAELRKDRDVTKPSGIYAYLLSGDPRTLSIRQFEDVEKRVAYERQDHRCANGRHCKTVGNDDGLREFSMEEMEADHIIPWSKGGHTVAENCQMLCVACNRDKSGT